MLKIREDSRTHWAVALGFLAYIAVLADPRSIDWYETFGLLLLGASIVVQLRSENY